MADLAAQLISAQPAEVRRAIRAGLWTGPTAGLARGYAQANVVILPEAFAADFQRFCELNPAPCPLLARTAPGEVAPSALAADADLRTDVPRYRLFRHGVLEPQEPTDIRSLWRDDLVAFLLGCSFTFEHALLAAGLPVRHLELGCNVPMFRTNVPCQPAGPFAGPLVVSMRPLPADLVPRAVEITARQQRMHGPPVHVGDPSQLGIADLGRPDFGDAVPLAAGEVPVFWACGVTPQLALSQVDCELVITHSPGCMFITDLTDESFCE